MYNADLKERFISQVNNESLKDVYRRIFEKVSVVEEELGLDLCQISDEEKIQEILSLIGGLKKNSTDVIVSRCRQYIKWCISEGIPGVTGDIVKISFNRELKFAEGLVSSADDLTKCLNLVFDKEIKHTYDNVCRCFYWLAFIGIRLDEVFDIKTYDVDLRRKKISHNRRVYDICDEAMPSITNCVKLEYFVYSHPNYSADITRNRVVSDQLLRGVKGEAKINTLKPTISKRVNEKSLKKLKYEKVHLSGIFCRLYQRESDGYPLNFEMAAEYYLKPNQPHRRIKTESSNLEYEYKVWKNVYNL